jgi:hypothetical protein
MNPKFKKWLEEQEYTLTDSGLFTYIWDEVMYYTHRNTHRNTQIDPIYRREFTWGLWRKNR